MPSRPHGHGSPDVLASYGYSVSKCFVDIETRVLGLQTLMQVTAESSSDELD
jgi:hypothetical protein